MLINTCPKCHQPYDSDVGVGDICPKCASGNRNACNYCGHIPLPAVEFSTLERFAFLVAPLLWVVISIIVLVLSLVGLLVSP